MAHLGEAQGVIESFHLKRVSPVLFESDDLNLLITGEGPLEAALQLTHLLSQRAFHRVINLGLAGTLDAGLAIGSVYPVRHHYLVIEGRPQFKSFKGQDSGLDCLTSFERILDPEKAAPLKGLGSLVDREAWGLAQAAKLLNVSFESHKLVSDLAGTLGACELVKEEAASWSMKLSSYLQELLKKKGPSRQIWEFIEGLHFTFSTEHHFQSLLRKIAIKEEKSQETVLQELPLGEIRSQKLLPKERTRRLLEAMETRLDPVRASVQHSLTGWKKDIENRGIKVEVDPAWEGPSVKISFDVDSDEKLAQKLQALGSFSLKPWHEILEGKIHVE